VSQRISFNNTQNFDINSTSYNQDLKQSTIVAARTITREVRRVTETEHTLSYPISVSYNQSTNADGSFVVLSASDQRYLENVISRRDGSEAFSSRTLNRVATQNTSNYTPQGIRSSHTGESSQRYAASDSRGYCYSRKLTSADNVLTAYQDRAECLH
jgi:hypothetical protein